MRVHRTAAVVFAAIVLSVAPIRAAEIEAEAIPGLPFGVGRVTVSAPDGNWQAASLAGGLSLRSEGDRVFYPVFTTGRLGRIVGRLLGGDGDAAPNAVTALFLFQGDAPLQITFYAPEPHVVRVTPAVPRRPPQAHQRLLIRWWRQYNAEIRERESAGDYPPLVETYLTSMLAQRLRLDPPLLSRLQQNDAGELQKTLQLLSGVESLRTQTLRRTMEGQGGFGRTADRPAPADIAWPQFDPPDFDDEVAVEPIALHVPEECFYVRFGKFSNYLWLDALVEDYGGELGSMITLRGHNQFLSRRMQQQLALKKTVLADLLGDTVIADVAIIGRDTFLREGAAIGVLFQARQNEVLRNQFNLERNVALKLNEENGATLSTVEIAGRQVSLLSTPDNKLRSYYAVDGEFHLHSTSRAMVERFFAAAQGERPLGASPEFRLARSLMPLNRDDTIFAYFSPSFFRGLVSPQYQIELNRRLQSVTDIELVHLARLAARGEEQESETIDDLIAGGFLPPGFGRRPDGSGPIIEENRIIDSLRGARGSFTPIPDVPLRGVTAEEEAAYDQRAAYYAENWGRMDPLVAGVKRYALNDSGLERLVIDAHVSPFETTKYGWIASMLGPPTTHRVAKAPDDVIFMQASLRGGLLDPALPPHQMFLGVKDQAPLTDLRPTGFLKTMQILQTTPAYLGAWPKPGFLDMLPLGLGGGEPDALGYSRSPLGFWRRQWDGFSVISYDREILDRTAPNLFVEETDDPAQIRIEVGDLSQSRLAGWVNWMNYDRSMQASLGNTRLLHAVSEQLRVPRTDALSAAENLLEAELACPLRGEYRLDIAPNGLEMWQSTAWPKDDLNRIPADYQAPLLEWFRGLDAGLTMDGDHLFVHAELDMQRKASAGKIELPLFNLFGGQAQKPQTVPAEQRPPETINTPPAEKKDAREF